MTANADIVRTILGELRCSDGSCPCHESFKAGQGKTHCAVPDHDDQNPSMGVEVKGEKLVVHCYSGCAQVDVVAALKARGVWFDSARSPIMPGLTVEQYAEAKNLSADELRSYGLSDIPYHSGHPAVRIPYFDARGNLGPTRFRHTMPKAVDGPDLRFTWKKGDKPTLYGWERRKSAIAAGHVVLVEGESDCHTLWHYNIPAVGVPGATNWSDARDAPYFDGIDTVYVVDEGDTGGDALRKALADSTVRSKIKFIRLDGVKDPSALHLDCVEAIARLHDSRLQDDSTPLPPRTVEDLFHRRWVATVAAAESFADQLAAQADALHEQAWEMCKALAHEPLILNHAAATIADGGVAGEERAVKTLYLAITSRVLSRPVSIVMKGPSSAGKSYTVEQVLRLFPPDAYYPLSGMSEHALAYSREPMEHRFLVLYEAAGLDGKFANYLLRSLLSEGRIRYETVMKVGDELTAVLIDKPGPTGLLMTTTEVKLHPENETRFFSIVVTDTPQQTKRILRAQAALALGGDTTEADLTPWHALQIWLAGAEHRATVPYADALVELIPPLAVRLRRDITAVFRFVQAHAVLHQATRDRDSDGRVVATLEDYAVVRDLVGDVIADGVEVAVPAEVREVVAAVKVLCARSTPKPKSSTAFESMVSDGVTAKAVGEHLKLDTSSAWRRVQVAIEKGFIHNNEDRKGRQARLVVVEDIPDDVQVLPTVEAVAARLGDCAISDSGDVAPPPPSPLTATIAATTIDTVIGEGGGGVNHPEHRIIDNVQSPVNGANGVARDVSDTLPPAEPPAHGTSLDEIAACLPVKVDPRAVVYVSPRRGA